MDPNERRARALLAAQFAGYPAEQRRINHGQLTHYESIHHIPAIIAALTPPEGYVLVPSDLSTLQRYDLGTVHFYGDEKEDIVECAWGSYVQLSDVQALLAARPEVP